MPRQEETTKDDENHRNMVIAKLKKYGFDKEANGYALPNSLLIAAVLALGERVAELEEKAGIRKGDVPPDLYLHSETTARAARPKDE
jgi:hypothetical protein